MLVRSGIKKNVNLMTECPPAVQSYLMEMSSGFLYLEKGLAGFPPWSLLYGFPVFRAKEVRAAVGRPGVLWGEQSEWKSPCVVEEGAGSLDAQSLWNPSSLCSYILERQDFMAFWGISVSVCFLLSPKKCVRVTKSVLKPNFSPNCLYTVFFGTLLLQSCKIATFLSFHLPW